MMQIFLRVPLPTWTRIGLQSLCVLVFASLSFSCMSKEEIEFSQKLLHKVFEGKAFISFQDLESQKQSGKTISFHISKRDGLLISESVLNWIRQSDFRADVTVFDLRDSNSIKKCLVKESKPRYGNGGIFYQALGIWIDSIQNGEIDVRILSLQHTELGPFSLQNNEKEYKIYLYFLEGTEFVKNGLSLPLEKPDFPKYTDPKLWK
jgi:hypothetical protein